MSADGSEAPRTIVQVIEANAAVTPDKPAIVTPDGATTYAQFWSVARGVTGFLHVHGPTSRVAVIVESSAEWTELAAGISWAGCTIVALSTWVEEWDLERLLEGSRPDQVFVSSRVRDGGIVEPLQRFFDVAPEADRPAVVEIGRATPRTGTSYGTVRAHAPLEEPVAAGASRLILYSSGSTAVPKGVVPVGETGEICVAGRVARGYLQPDGSVRPIIDADGYCHNGDRGRLDEEEWLTYVARASIGIKVSPAEVEMFPVRHQEIVSALALGMDEPGGEALAAMIVTDVGSSLYEDAVRAWCKWIAIYKISVQVMVVDALRTTRTGKISRAAARVQTDERACPSVDTLDGGVA